MKVKQTYGKNITVEIDVFVGSKLTEVEVEKILARKAAAHNWEEEPVCAMCPPMVETGEIIKFENHEHRLTKNYRDLQ